VSLWLPFPYIERFADTARDHHKYPEAAVEFHRVLSHLDIENSSVFPPMPGGGHVDEIRQRR
jgi:hypothetical protein